MLAISDLSNILKRGTGSTGCHIDSETQYQTTHTVYYATYIHIQHWPGSTLPCKLAVDSNFLSLAQSNCLSVWLIVSICFYLPVFPIPPWSSVSFFLSYSVHPFLIYYEYHNIRPWGALPRNYTPFALTQMCWSIYHTYQECAVNIWSHPLSLGGGGGLIQHTHTLNTHHTQTAKHPDVSVNSMTLITRTHTGIHTYTADITNLLSLSWFVSSYWFSMAPLGTVEPYPV